MNKATLKFYRAGKQYGWTLLSPRGLEVMAMCGTMKETPSQAMEQFNVAASYIPGVPIKLDKLPKVGKCYDVHEHLQVWRVS